MSHDGYIVSNDVEFEMRRRVPAVRADHRAPPGGSVGDTDGLDHVELRQRIEFGTPEPPRHRHAEHAAVAQELHARLRQLAVGFTPRRFGPKRFLRRACSFENRLSAHT